MNSPSVAKTTFKVVDFISWAKKGQLQLSPEFQRRSVWKEGAKSYLIDTIYRGFPIPIVFLRERETDLTFLEPKRDVIDGQQRLRTLIAYILPKEAKAILKDYDVNRDVFSVKKEHNADIAGKTFDELAPEEKQNLLQYEISVQIVPASIDDRDIYSIFRRLNSTNFNLKGQELRNSQFFGLFKTSQYNLAGEQLNRWRKWKTFTDEDIARMDEVELTSEISMAINEKKIMGKSSRKIDDYYAKHDSNYKSKLVIEKRFRSVLDFIDKSFDPKEIVFFNKRLFYTFFMACYHLLYGLESELKTSTPGVISTKVLSRLRDKNTEIKTRTAKQQVLDATDRRTTNIKERTTLYKYLIS